MAFRFSDNILHNIEEGSDFVIRRRVPRAMMIFIIFLGAFDLICVAAYLTNDTSVNAIFLMVLFVSIGVLAWGTYYFINRFRKLVLVTEFQTAMLASATQIGTRFCFIVNAEGTIFYVDPGFQKVFSGFTDSGDLTFRGLLAFIEVPEVLRQRMNAVMKQSKSDSMVLTLNDKEGKSSTFVVTIDVIPRPKGYFIIRGRDYVEKRAEVKLDDNVPVLLSKAVSSLPALMLIADANAIIVSISEQLEQWLGYEPGEIVDAKLQLKQVLHQYGGNQAGMVLLKAYEGGVTVQKKDRSQVDVTVRQALLTANNRTAGISVIITE